MTTEELTDHQIRCLHVASWYDLMSQIYPDFKKVGEQGRDLCIKFAARAAFRARQIDMGRPDPGEKS